MIPMPLRAGLVAILLVVGGMAHAIDAQDAFDDPVLQERYENINRELRCLVCQNQTIAGSFESAPPKSSSIMIGWTATTPMKALSWRSTLPSR